MLLTHTTFIGIDPTAGQKPFVYAALDGDLRLLALGRGGIDEVLAFTAGQRQAYAAVCAPRRPNLGFMAQEAFRQQLSPLPRPGRWMNLRLAEYLLRQHNIGIPQTYAREQDCPNWMQMGFSLFQRMEKLGYRPCVEGRQKTKDEGRTTEDEELSLSEAKEPSLSETKEPALSETKGRTAEGETFDDGKAKDGGGQENFARYLLEAYPHACFTVLLGLPPFPKHTLEGRIQRQLVLFERQVSVPDPMRFFEEITRHRLLRGILPYEDLYSPEELDALVAAYTAWLAAKRPEQTTLLGDPAEGQIVLPAAELKPRYESSHSGLFSSD